LNLSAYVVDFDKEYEFVEEIREVELWRKVERGEEVEVENYKAERREGTNENVDDIFVREVEALFRLKHPFILSFKGYCLPKGEDGARLVTGHIGNASLKDPLVG
jgi:hypothetical protein